MIERVIIYPSAESIVWKSDYQTRQLVNVYKYAYWGVLGSFRWGCEEVQLWITRADCEQLVKGYRCKVNGRWVKLIPVMPLIGSLYPEI